MTELESHTLHTGAANNSLTVNNRGGTSGILEPGGGQSEGHNFKWGQNQIHYAVHVWRPFSPSEVELKYSVRLYGRVITGDALLRCMIL